MVGFEVLPEEVQAAIVTFLPLSSIFNFSLVSASCLLVAYHDEYVWKDVASRYHRLEHYNDEQLWRNKVKEFVELHFEPESRADDSLLELSNSKRTVSCSLGPWQTIRGTTELQRGKIWSWEYELVKYTDDMSNVYKIYVGIEGSDYDFNCTEEFHKIIGYGKSSGVGINLGMQAVQTRDCKVVTTRERINDFKNGDVVTVVFDMVTKESSNTMKVYKNGEWFITASNIPNGDDWVWYPALSLVDNRTVTISAGTSFNLHGERLPCQ